MKPRFLGISALISFLGFLANPAAGSGDVCINTSGGPCNGAPYYSSCKINGNIGSCTPANPFQAFSSCECGPTFSNTYSYSATSGPTCPPPAGCPAALWNAFVSACERGAAVQVTALQTTAQLCGIDFTILTRNASTTCVTCKGSCTSSGFEYLFGEPTSCPGNSSSTSTN